LATKTPPPVVCHSDSAIIELQSAAIVAKPWRPLVRYIYFFSITMRNNMISARAFKRSRPSDGRNFHHYRNDDEIDLGVSVGICRVLGVAERSSRGPWDSKRKFRRHPQFGFRHYTRRWPQNSASTRRIETVVSLARTQSLSAPRPVAVSRYPIPITDIQVRVRYIDDSVMRTLYCVLYSTNYYTSVAVTPTRWPEAIQHPSTAPRATV